MVVFSIQLIGNHFVGSSTIRQSIIKDSCKYNDFTSVNKTFKEIKYLFRIWCIKSSERFYRIPLCTYKCLKGVLFVIDITNRSSLSYITKEIIRIKQLKLNADNSDKPIFYMISNKCDLENQRVISKEEVKNICEEHGYKYFECSALSGENSNEIFHFMIREIIEKEALLQEQNKN